MKVLWKDLHCKLSYFNEKYLRQQSTYIPKRGCILESPTEEDEVTNLIGEYLVRPSTNANNNIA